MISPAYRFGALLAKEAFLTSIDAAFDAIRQVPQAFEHSYNLRASVDPARFPALAYTQPVVSQSQGEPYATFDQNISPAPHRHRRHH